MIYACDKCRFVFESDVEDKQCPDCGKFAVRQANEFEIKDYIQYQSEKDKWEDTPKN